MILSNPDNATIPRAFSFALRTANRLPYPYLTIYMLLTLLIAGLYPLSAFAQPCPSFPTDVSNTTELNEAISCYNDLDAGTYEIRIAADFTLTSATTRINNANGASLAINGNDHTLDGAGSFRFFTIDRSTVLINDMTLQNGRHADAGRDECFSETCGGAIALFSGFNAPNPANATVTNVDFINNNGFFGGAIFHRGGTLEVGDSTFSNNSANDGGGIYSEREAIIKGNTFDNNQAVFGGAIMPAFFGSYDIVNNTISNNTATTNGGGMRVAFIQLHDRFNLHNNTFFGNSAPDGANVRIEGTNPFSIKNNIFADGIGGDNCFSQRPIDATNIAGDASCDAATQSANFNLGLLQDNGGPTFTHALLTGSDAIDAGDDAICIDPPVEGIDQRGFSRVQQGASCDVGSYEVNCDLTFPVDVDSTESLNEAIRCYNSFDAGTYEMNIVADFTLTSATTRIDNANDAILVINGNDHTLDGADSFRFFTIDRSTVLINDMTLQNGRHADAGRDECFSETCGGAIALFSGLNAALPANAIVANVEFISNNGFFGGAIFHRGGVLEVAGSTFSNNSANDGGGIYSEREAIIKGNTFDSNQAVFGGAIMPAFFGSYDIVNNTISNNTATTNGGGMRVAFIQLHDRFNLHNNTFFGNSAPDGANVRIEGTNPFSIKNNIFADGIGGDNCFSQRPIDATNIAGDASCDAATQSANFNLGPLQDNGGPTFTHALLAGSDAIDAGDDAICTDPPVEGIDQRGVSRPQGAACDIGAFEADNDAPVAANDIFTTNEDTPLTVAAPGVLGNDSDADGDGLTAVLTTEPGNGLLTLNSDGSFSYTPNDGFTGDDSFTYQANDGIEDSNIATVTITVDAELFASCGGFDVFETDPNVYEAPGFEGNLIVGTENRDLLFGTNGADLILGLGGNDLIYGKRGHDVICGGKKADLLVGGPGNDQVYGANGTDVLFGGLDDDNLFGGKGRDLLYGNPGNDVLNGGSGNDFCRGGVGDDAVEACER